jgi:uncharacterized BrkB/YihY/UPF0761 family membrane protein
MSFEDFMSKIRQWDNQCARWMMRHFYIMFFEFVLVAIFFIFLFNTLSVLDLASTVPPQNLTERLLLQQTMNTLIIIILLLLNSFWMLYMFHGMGGLKSILKEISYNIMRRRNKED